MRRANGGGQGSRRGVEEADRQYSEFYHHSSSSRSELLIFVSALKLIKGLALQDSPGTLEPPRNQVEGSVDKVDGKLMEAVVDFERAMQIQIDELLKPSVGVSEKCTGDGIMTDELVRVSKNLVDALQKQRDGTARPLRGKIRETKGGLLFFQLSSR